MKTPINFIILFIFLIFSSSCNFLIKTFFHVEKPYKVPKYKQVQYLLKNNADTTLMYCLDTLEYEKLKKKPFKPGRDTGFKGIQIRSYDKYGKANMQWTICEGYLDSLKTFSTFPPKNWVGLDTSVDLNGELEILVDYQGNKNVKRFTGDSLTLFVYYMYCLRGFDKKINHIKRVNEYLKKFPDKKIRVYYVSTDAQLFWKGKLESELKIRF